MKLAKQANFFSIPPTGKDKKYICPPHRDGPQYVFGGGTLFKTDEVRQGGRGSKKSVFSLTSLMDDTK